MSQKLMGRKLGMTHRYDKQGKAIPCTVVEVEPNVVTQIKTVEKDGYAAVQTGFDTIKSSHEKTVNQRIGQARHGHFKKSGLAPMRFLTESRLQEDIVCSVGDQVTVELFAEGSLVDITAKTIGKGYQGLMKKNNFSGGPAAHGSGFHRHAGSTGMRSTPGRCFPGGPRPSQMGNWKRTVQNMRIVDSNVEQGVLLIKGAVPGAQGSLVVIQRAKKAKS